MVTPTGKVGKILNPNGSRTSRDRGTCWARRPFCAREPGVPSAPLTLGKSTDEQAVFSSFCKAKWLSPLVVTAASP